MSALALSEQTYRKCQRKQCTYCVKNSDDDATLPPAVGIITLFGREKTVHVIHRDYLGSLVACPVLEA